MRYLLLSLLLLTSHNAFASIQLVPKWAFEKNAASEGVGAGERLYGLEVLCPIGEAMKIKTEFGGWISKQDGRSSSLYTSISWGYRVASQSGPFFEAFVGPTWISKPDSQLGSHLQISHDLSFGWLKDGWGVGLGFKHISNAGMSQPNRGRDFLGFRFLIPLG